MFTNQENSVGENKTLSCFCEEIFEAEYRETDIKIQPTGLVDCTKIIFVNPNVKAVPQFQDLQSFMDLIPCKPLYGFLHLFICKPVEDDVDGFSCVPDFEVE